MLLLGVAKPQTTYILDSFEGAPPVTLATRRFSSSVLSSSSCLVSSFFSFWRNSEHLTFTYEIQGEKLVKLTDFRQPSAVNISARATPLMESGFWGRWREFLRIFIADSRNTYHFESLTNVKEICQRD